MTRGTIKTWYLVHKWTSLICTAFLLMLCVTGLPLIFEEEIDGWFNPPAAMATLPADTPSLSLDAILDRAAKAAPGEVPLYQLRRRAADRLRHHRSDARCGSRGDAFPRL
jgi:uncharacterized iron-regulated membrane protein